MVKDQQYSVRASFQDSRKFQKIHESEKTRLYKVVKMDLDFAPPDSWLVVWEATRFDIIKGFDQELVKLRAHPSKHGWHYWFHISPGVDYETLGLLKFLLGDDHHRVWFHQQRTGFTKYRRYFDMLFSKKVVHGDEQTQ